ncbi:carotenoid oxygenase [Melanomma pulvis-pyrius CBS 109.77]|uniref:Carotenoid oxygenase n=1 Tax=Melanomma pulvis-pyrius CBS 109.77 TaxID=1314802 RepID=A0A6A6WX07_9PLEO|nr:carotenoid oxygenase [Melanomma pulvis-pyrius CBS 109.77]
MSSDKSVTQLKSKCPVAIDLQGSNLPYRLEVEVADLMILGTVPPEIDGTFYRVMTDPFVPPHPNNIPLDGDGNISALRFRDGRVDFKMRYVETERFKIERNAGKAVFGLNRNPFTHHPCVRAAVDSTPIPTLSWDQVETFTAHPKIDSFTKELVVYGYEAKGLASTDIVIYPLDRHGQKKDEQWIKSPWCAPIHDYIERMKKGGHHWAWNYDRSATFIVAPRRKRTKLPAGWKEGEFRVYHDQNEMLIHTAGAWESDDGSKPWLETTRVHENAFPFFPADSRRQPAPDATAYLVRFTLNLTQPTDTKVAETKIIPPFPAEFPRLDEHFLSKPYDVAWLNAMTPAEFHDPEPEGEGGVGLVWSDLDGVVQHRYSTGKTEYYYAGRGCGVQEPIFIPRLGDAPEGDGWVMFLVEIKLIDLCELVILFTKPVAIVKLLFHIKAQVHGNWIDQRQFKDRKSLVRQGELETISGRGALETGDI